MLLHVVVPNRVERNHVHVVLEFLRDFSPLGPRGMATFRAFATIAQARDHHQAQPALSLSPFGCPPEGA
jgi:hypothetical protein